MKIGAFVIHLQRARQRKPQVERILAACPVPARVIDAVDGRAMSAQERAAVYARKLHEPRYPFELGPGEIGCFLSHRKAWQEIVDAGLDAGLVIEDDVEIEPDVFGPALDLAYQHVYAHGVIQFQVRSIQEGGPEIARAVNVTLTRPEIVPLRMSCTLISRAAAERLLKKTGRFDRPVDGVMQMTWLTGLFPLIAVPSGVTEYSAELGGTTIQQVNPSLITVARREVLRPYYRFQIRRYSRAAARNR